MKFVYANILAALCLTVLADKNSLLGMDGQAFAVVGSHTASRRQTRSVGSSITRMHVTSVVRSRFAKVTTVSEIANTQYEAKEITFSIRIPEAAFISEFTMVVSGVTFVGKVKEKARAQEEYDAAKGKGNPTGLVTGDVRQTQTFNVAANVPAESSVTFTLVYQELLKRRLSEYNHVIFVNPGQLVDDFIVNVYITERSGITVLKTKHPKIGSGERGKVAGGYDINGEVQIDTEIRRSKFQAKVTFKPSPVQQRRLLMIPEDDRKLSVIYDVTREELGGKIQTRDGYFVHYFAPKNLPILPKKVVFVIDRSGSMYGTKMKQTKAAFETVLRDMAPEDEFNIVTFSGDVKVWKTEQMVQVTTESVSEAISYVRAIDAAGSTNLNEGVLKATTLLKLVRRKDKVSSAVILLTDGEPTVGVTDNDEIRTNVRQAIRGRFSLFCLGFGEYLNHDFLKKLAADNDGISRKIFEDSDADLQLQGFFQEVATPLLLNVKISYRNASVTHVSKTNVEKYFGGSEIIVVGKLVDQDKPVKSKITGVSRDRKVKYNVVSEELDEEFVHGNENAGNFSHLIERIWAYYTIKGLMEKKVLEDSNEEVQKIVNRAMHLSLKYGFVTPLTAMVVVLPEDEITTTSSPISTVYPPLPPCFFRGAALPDSLVRPPIWCPYVVDEADIDNQEQSQGRRILSSRPRVASLSRSVGRPRTMSLLYAPSRHWMASSMSSNRMAGSRHRSRETVKVVDDCGENLRISQRRITSPGDLGHKRRFYCDWTVTLTNGSWIDLYIEKLNTTLNAVKIESNDEVLLNHRGGVKRSKYISVAHNQIKIRMTINPHEAEGGVVIFYKEFVPGDSAPGESIDVEGNGSPASTNCNHEISSDSRTGSIESPHYPHAYPSEANCLWNIVNKNVESLRLQLRIDALDIETNELGECVYDKLVITSGNEMHKTLCGFHSGQNITSDDAKVKISFSSDGKFEGSGFNIAYEFVSRDQNITRNLE